MQNPATQTIEAHLLTPRDWQAEALVRAASLMGTPEGARVLVEAKRYGALASQIERLTGEIAHPGLASKSIAIRIATQMGWRPPKPTPDWGAIDGVLHDILREVKPEGTRLVMLARLRILLRKVSGF